MRTDLRVAGVHEPLDLLDDDLDGLAPAPAPGERHDAEAAAVLAAVLHLHEGSRVPRRESPDRDDRERPRLEDVAHLDERARALPDLLEERRQGVPVLGAEDQVHPGDRRDRLRVGLRVAPGHDDHRLGIPRDGATDRLAIRVVGAGRHGAGVDDVHLRRGLERHRPESPAPRAGPGPPPCRTGSACTRASRTRPSPGSGLDFDFHASRERPAAIVWKSRSDPARRRAGRTRRRRPRPWTSGSWRSGRRRGALAGTRGSARAAAAGSWRRATR